MSPTATAFIRFPPPPPTRNELSSEQRAKLIRTNNKLGQVLGSTPHVLDLSYIIPTTQIDLPLPKTPTSRKNPFRKHSRTKSVDIDAARASAKSPDSVASRTSASSRRSTSTVRVKADELAWRSPYPMQRPPLLQLAVPNPSRSRRPKLETIPGSPPFNQVTTPFDPPSFSLPSEAAMRREKMRRVRKMLGDGVPTDLVFPSSPEESESDSEEDSPVVSTPTSAMSREWLLVNTDKPLPSAPYASSEPSKPEPEPVPVPAARPKRPSPKRVQPKALEPEVRPNRLFKERPKERPSKSATTLESIAESAKEARPDSSTSTLTCVGVSASAGMSGMGKSRRFVRGEIAMDQIGAVWGGVGCTMSDSANDIVDLIDAYTSIQTDNFIQFVVITLFTYDFVITLDSEMKFMWKRRLSLASVIIFWTRYCYLLRGLTYVVIFVALSHSETPSGDHAAHVLTEHRCSCTVAQYMNSALQHSLYIPFAAFSGMRAYALCKSWAISGLIAALSLSPAFINLTNLAVHEMPVLDPDFGCGLTDSITLQDLIMCTPLCRLTSFSRGALIVADILLVGITWRTLYNPKGPISTPFQMHKQASFSNILLWNGILYFLLLSILNILHLTFTVTEIFASGIGIYAASEMTRFTESLTAILTYRFILDLQEAKEHNVKVGTDDRALGMESMNTDSVPSFIDRAIRGSLGWTIPIGVDHANEENEHDVTSEQRHAWD
ncbi:hypothetical protein C8Q80DRAFT_1271677 [Daedaleopsis nitida]|nr:hypothetical protein C8Q80DRAFT_1271677 [Daedaleopsis nitida]